MTLVRRLCHLALAAGLFSLALPAWGQYLRIYYPDIEQGSSTLVVSPTGRALLVDAGSELNPADDDVVTYILDLIDAGIVTSFDYVVATHYDEDHIGRLEQVLQYGGVSPTIVTYDRGTFGQTPSSFAYSDYAWAASSKNRTTITPFTDIDLGGGVVVECYSVNGDLRDGSSVDISASGQFENSASVGLVVRYGNFDAWIGGDLTGNPDQGVADVESPVAPLAWDVDVYTFNHHGSRTSSNATFLSALKAEVGINQNSASNGFGHPNTEVVTRVLATPDSFGLTPLFIQQNPGNPTDARSDDSLASAIADPDDIDEPFGLPGSMTVISDGDSYQVFGGALAPIELPADSGPGTLGDFPPAVLATSRSPLVPLASQAVTVSTDVVDGGAVSVFLEYEVDGIAQAPIAMTAGGGTSYSAALPGQSDGTQVRFRVRAVDGLGQVGLSAAQGYYAGVTPVAVFRVNDGDGVLVPKHFGVRIEGSVTAEPGLFNTFVSQIFVQDATGGVQIFDRVLLPLVRGDVAQFVGELEQFGGATELNMSQDFGNYGHTFLAAGSAPAPQVVTVAQVGEAVEGRLIRINGVSVVAGEIPELGSGNVTISDDGGLSTLTLRIDGETDLPGSPTPTLGFDVIGIASQFDGSHPFNSGYQIIPRGKEDVLSDEISLPSLLINEIHADPDAAGDANGDGSVSSTQDEFVELVNTGFEPLDVSGFYLADDTQVRHVFPSGTVVPAREALVVFGGGTPTGDFGNAGANGLVFTASSGRLGLNNGGDTVTLYDAGGVVIQAVAYGSEGGQDQSLVRDPDLTNTPLALHTQVLAAGGARYSPGTLADGSTFTVGPGQVLLTEVLYDPSGADSGLEWVELYNATDHDVDLGTMSLGGGGSDYTSTLVQLAGILGPGETFVIGGPDSTSANGTPVIDLPVAFSPGLQNSGTTADGVALFNLRAARVMATTVPVDAVVYGGSNTSGLIDETGAANAPEVGDAPGGSSIERIDLAGTWQIQSTPNPNAFSAGSGPPPPAGTVILSEVFYDPSGADNGLEWVELYNPGSVAVDLSGYSLGGGGSDYTYTLLQLSGTLAPGQTFVVGGTTSNATNYDPVFDQAQDFSPDLQNSGSPADGVALFDVPASSVTALTVPVDAVVYGSANGSGLIDETGAANAPEVGDAPTGSSIERIDLAGSWQIQSTPTPNATPLP